jgi:hypothetical protein
MSALTNLRLVAYSHKVRRLLKQRHEIWLTGLPVGGPAFEAFIEVCTFCFVEKESAERAAGLYAATCHVLDRHPESFAAFADAITAIEGAQIEAKQGARS